MDIPGIFQNLTKSNSPPPLAINTDTMMDLATGQFVDSVDRKHFILDGGITPTFGMAARPERFKSTEALSWNVRAWERCPGSYLIIMDSENSINNIERVLSFSTLYLDDPEKREKHLEELRSRLIYRNKTDIEHVDEFYGFLVTQIFDVKDKNRKALTVDTPFLDNRTQQGRKMLVPTFVVIDSWSDIKTRAGLETALSGVDASDTKSATQYMRDGNAKNAIINKMLRDGAKYGIFFTLIAHIGRKFDMNAGPMSHPTKEMQNRKVDDTLKKVGGDFSFLMSTHIDINNSAFLTAGDKSCMYPFSKGSTNDRELSRLSMTVVRNKRKGSGDQWSNIVSQNRGDQADLTNFQLLKDYKSDALVGSVQNPACVFFPDVLLPRNKAYERFCSNRKLARAVQICAQLCYIQNHWTKPEGVDIPFDIKPHELKERLDKLGKTDEVLSSRGWWSYGFKEIPYYSILDILSLVKDVKP